MPPPVVLVIDGNSLVHRSFHAMAESSQPDWAVRGLLTQLVAAVDRVRPTAVVVGFDDADRSLRRDRWPQYKANRTEKLPSLVDQLESAIAVMRELGLAVVVPPGLEADDVSASAAARARQAGGRSVIVTSDRDAFALIDEHTSVLRIINGGVDASPLITPERLMLLLGVRPDQYRDFAALRGDPSDNLPGVRGVGPRTAARLLAEFGCAAKAFADLDAVRERLGAGVATRLAADGAHGAWELNCRVMAMRDDVPLGTDLVSGPGVLPVAPDAVDAVFAAQRLVWTAGRAAHLLAGAPESMPRERTPEPWAERPVLRRRERQRSAPRAAALVPAVDQLSLF